MENQKVFVSKFEFYTAIAGVFMLMSCILGFVEPTSPHSANAIFNSQLILIVLSVVSLARAIMKK